MERLPKNLNELSERIEDERVESYNEGVEDGANWAQGKIEDLEKELEDLKKQHFRELMYVDNQSYMDGYNEGYMDGEYDGKHRLSRFIKRILGITKEE